MLMGTWLRHIYRFERKYNKDFARDPLFGAYLMDRIHKRVQVFSHSCNTTAIEDLELGNLLEFGGLQKKVERGEWFTLTPVWVDRPSQKEEVCRKSDGHNIGAMPSGRGIVIDAVFKHEVDPQLRIMERLGDMTSTARLENLRIPLAADGRDICLRFLSKGDCIRSCTHSHAPVQVHNREVLIRYISIGRDVMDLSKERKFNGGVESGIPRGALVKERGKQYQKIGGTEPQEQCRTQWRTRWSL